ncbi:MAG: ATP-binding protein [Kosmotoga sp.]|nr:MAG: ATP-binding protein [Kosmotoga sp.]
MNYDSTIEILSLIQERNLQKLPRRLRPFYERIKFKNRAILIFGPRGVGKTTFILSRIKNKSIFYLSTDNPLVSAVSLWDLGNAIFMKGYDGIAIDEVHYSKDWSIHLKALYDAFPDKIIWASDSSNLTLRHGIADLSRRFSRIEIPLMSFREYLALKEGVILPVINPLSPDRKLIKKTMDSAKILYTFQNFMEEGFRPVFLEWDYQEQTMNIIEKTLHGDIPFFVPQITNIHFRLMNAIVGYLAMSKIPTINVEGLCNEWGISKVKLYQLLHVMDATGLIRIIYHKNDTKTFSKGAKIFLADPSFYSVLGGEIGTRREAFVVAAFSNAGKKVFASKNEEAGDFLVDGAVIEVGGKNKSKKKADYVIRDNIDLPNRNIIPLWLLGFMY